MTIRQLTKEEKKMCKAGLKRRAETLKDLNEELNYLEQYNAFNRKFADYLIRKEEKAKQKKDLILDVTLNNLIDAIKEEKRMIKVEQNQLDNGVEIKEKQVMPGVN